MISPHLVSSSLIPPAACGPGTAVVFCVCLLGFGIAFLIGYLVVRAAALAQAQEREHALLLERAAKPLSRGPSRVVEGRVELDGAEDVAVEIDIIQSVIDVTTKNSTSHSWKEVSRSVRAAPFYLVRDDGEQVYVEPSEGALIVDSLETRYPTELARKRVRAADVRRGERFFAYGDLVEGLHPRARQGYRDGLGWILRTPRTDRMLLATQAIRDRYAPRILFLRRSALWLAVGFCIFHGLVTLPFVAARLFGTVPAADVTGTSTYLTHNKGNTTTHYVISARTADGFALVSDVPQVAFTEVGRVRAYGGAPVQVPILRTFDWSYASYLGDEPSVSLLGVILGVTGALFLLLIVRLGYGNTIAWYDRAKLSEHGGTGHWRETRPASPVDPAMN